MESHSFVIGQDYLIRTVTWHYTGKLVSITDHDLVLVKAAWIGHEGRLYDALKSGIFVEVEPYPDDMRVIIMRGAIVDAVPWPHILPREQKPNG